MSWDGSTAAWWAREIADDPSYEQAVDPLLRRVLGEEPDGVVLDLGCGNGRHGELFSTIVGVDSSAALVTSAFHLIPACVGDVTRLPFGDDSVAAAYAVLVLEHIADHRAFFMEAGRVVRPGGWLAVVLNHPLWTAPGSGPFVDPEDGEVLWRWGAYLESGHTDEPAGEGTVRFHHRPLGGLLGAASDAGWVLEVLIEEPVAPDGDPILAAQAQIPRLMGVRWRR